MPLDQDQLNKVNAWMTQKGALKQCESCGHTDWAAGEIVAALAFAGGAFQIGGNTVPMLQMLCQNCANIRLYAAVPLGIIK